jgi:hypothetical protein
LVAHAHARQIENDKKVRIDSTVCLALMHPPADKSLLRDFIRAMTRLPQDGGNFRAVISCGATIATPPRGAPLKSFSVAARRSSVNASRN